MTEAMSRREIEDILVSIRKLVSHDPNAPLPPRPQPDIPALGKLVLTSALRVSDGPSDAPPAHGDDGAQGMADGDCAGPVAAPHVSRREDSASSLLARIARSAGNQTSIRDDHATPPEATPPEATPPDAAPIAVRGAGNIDAPPRLVPDAVADVQDWLNDADIPLPAHTGPERTQPPHLSQPDGATDVVLEETLARLEAMLSGQQPAPAALHPAPDVTDRAPDPAGAQARTRPEPATDADADDAGTIDEAMLYQLVADIVRQELQGELGEKITRAIRKLVRSEVARELQLRNL